LKILITSIVDLKKSQHNRPHQFVKYLSKKREVRVLSINDWWKGKRGLVECNRYTAVLTFILAHLAIRGLSLVNGNCCIKSKIKKQGLFFPTQTFRKSLIKNRASIQ